MKRFAVLMVGVVLVFAALRASTISVSAQVSPTPQATAAPAGDTLSAQDVLNAAQQAKANADAANAAANNVVNNANNAVNTVNLLLNFVQAASLFGGVLASVFAILGARFGSRSLTAYREELKKAQAELEEMHSGLNRETEQVRLQADRAIRALALMQLGEQQLERHNTKGALQMYKQAYDLDPDNGAINYFLGELYIQDNRLDQAIEHLERSLKADADFAPAEAALGYALRQQANNVQDPTAKSIMQAKSEERMIRAVHIDPSALDIHGEPVQAGLGALYKRQERIGEAIAAYEAARQIAPDKSYPIVNLAILNYRQGNVGKASAYFEQVIRMSDRDLASNPQDFWARLNRLTAQLALGHPEAAREEFETVRKQVTTAAPLETAVADLTSLRNAPTPLVAADQVIPLMNDAIAKLKA